jgi:hypothetical protein
VVVFNRNRVNFFDIIQVPRCTSVLFNVFQ